MLGSDRGIVREKFVHSLEVKQFILQQRAGGQEDDD